jgi:uncharacterized membrane protein
MITPNNWKLKTCLLVSITILLAMLGLVGLADLGIDIPVLRQIVGFIFLALVPGFLILRILRVHKTNMIESLVYAVGLSIAFVMFSGALANFILPLVGVSKPISVLPITVVLAISTLILGGIAYWRDHQWEVNNSTAIRFDLREMISPPYLLLLLLPLVAIVGSQFVRFYENNVLLLVLVVLIAWIIVLFAFGKLPRNAYPLAIVSIAISLLLQNSLISSQLNGGDIHAEYYFQNLVATNGYWDFRIVQNLNTALSIVILNPIYALMLNLSGIWVFKLVYSIVFSLVPLALFQIFRIQMGGRIAFFSVLLFVGTSMFFGEMTYLARQEIAELFFALLILLVVDRRLSVSQRTALSLVFATSLIVSHYALGAIYSAFLIGGWLLVFLIWKVRAMRLRLPMIIRPTSYGTTAEASFPARTVICIIGIYLFVAFSWYGAIGGGQVLSDLKDIGNVQSALLSSEITGVAGQPSAAPTPIAPTPIAPTPIKPTPAAPTPSATAPPTKQTLVYTAFGFDFLTASPLGKAFRIFQYTIEVFIVVGLIELLFRRGDIVDEYIALTAVAVLILAACIFLPMFSSYLQVTRFYHICLFFLAPFCIWGYQAVWRALYGVLQMATSRLKALSRLVIATGLNAKYPILISSFAVCIIVPYLLFNAGFFFEITRSERFAVNDSPSSIALSSYRLDMPVFNNEEAASAKWLAEADNSKTKIYSDVWSMQILNEVFPDRVTLFSADNEEIKGNAYVYLRSWNIRRSEYLLYTMSGVREEFKEVEIKNNPALLGLINNASLVYNDGNSHVRYHSTN